MFYQPFNQAAWASDLYFLLRSSTVSEELAETLRLEARSLDAELPVTDIASLETLVARSVSAPRFRTLLLGTLATLAGVLALMGIYGVLSFAVANRAHEIGVRLALGAERSRIVTLVVFEGLTLAGFGILLRVTIALVLTRFLAGMLYAVTLTDPVTFAGIVASVILISGVACYVPARRASRMDPLVALRDAD